VMTSSYSPPKHVTRDDIEAKLEELRGGVDEGVDQARNIGTIVAVVAVGALVVGAFLLGRRRGKKRQTIVEIRRV